MAVRVVEVVSPTEALLQSSPLTVVVEIVDNATSPITTTVGASAVEVLGNNLVQNAYVSETAPVNPYEGQVWIDIS